MSVKHKFYQKNFKNGFETHNAILDIMPYRPEIMIIGTFNPELPKTNYADFYYGRNFFWPALMNLFVHNEILISNRRIPTRGDLPNVLIPTLQEVFDICCNLKLTFADLILEVLHRDKPNYKFLKNNNVFFNNAKYNLIQDGKKTKIGGLQQLDSFSQINWNTQNIINYLCANTQINSIYLTRQPTGIWAKQWNEIINNSSLANRRSANIFTPSGAGKPVFYSMKKLLNHWVHNNNANFGQIDNDWLRQKQVNLNNFDTIQIIV